MTDRVTALTERDWVALREIRLRALADSPTSFGSTLAAEEAFADARWRERAGGSATTRLFIAWHGGSAVGVAGVFDEGDGTVQLVSVWVDPQHRGRGVASLLTSSALHFAASHGFTIVRLWVTDGNDGALKLYERFGFTLTGNHQPLPSDPSLREHEMELLVAPPTAEQ